MRKIKQTKSYMSHEFSDDAVPLPGFRVFRAVLPVRYQLQSVSEADLPRHRLQKVHAKTVKPRVPRVVFFVVHHHVRYFLRRQHDIHAENGTRCQIGTIHEAVELLPCFGRLSFHTLSEEFRNERKHTVVVQRLLIVRVSSSRCAGRGDTIF